MRNPVPGTECQCLMLGTGIFQVLKNMVRYDGYLVICQVSATSLLQNEFHNSGVWRNGALFYIIIKQWMVE